MLDHQDLYKQIPKNVSEWTEDDVAKWFQINDIELEKKIKINGEQFLKLTSTKIIRELKLSSFLTRKIADWIQFQTSDFNEFVREMQHKQKNVKESKSKSQNLKEIQLKSQQVQQKQSEIQQKLQTTQEMQQKLQTAKHQTAKEIQQKPLCVEQKFQKSESQSKQKTISQFQIQQEQQKQQISDEEGSKHIKPELMRVNSAITEKSNSQLSHQENFIEFPLAHEQSLNHQQFKQKPNKKKIQEKQLILQQNKSNSLQSKVDLKNKLVLKDLVEISTESQEDTATCNQILDPSNEFQNKKKQLIKISSENLLTQSGSLNFSQKFQYSNQVKFISSQLIFSNASVLTAYYNQGNQFTIINKNIKIGRNASNDLILKTEGVSRNHAQVLVEEQLGEEQKVVKRYYLRDVGSKFGTFVEVDPQKPKKIAENQFYCIGQTTIRIDKLKVHKQKDKFDIAISIILAQEQQKFYLNKSSVTIGNRRRQSQPKQFKNCQITKRSQKQKKDLELDSNFIKNNHCRFTIINSEVYLEQVEGNFLQKIEKNVKYQLTRNKYDVKFGDGDVLFKIQQQFKPFLNKNQFKNQ